MRATWRYLAAVWLAGVNVNAWLVGKGFVTDWR